MIFLDTHVAVWLHQGSLDLLSATAKEMIETEDLAISPAVRLELEFLHEIGRIKPDSSVILADLKDQLELVVADDSFDKVSRAACSIHWTRDPFDRLIAGHALTKNAALLTKDRRILENYQRAAW